MQNSTELPALKMLVSNDLIPHEDVDPRRTEKLVKRILEEGWLKNPVVVTSIPGTEKWVVLDGANRTMAFQSSGIPNIVGQVVSYADPGVQLDTWYHVVSSMSLAEFEGALKGIPDLQLRASTLKEARWLLETEQALAYIVCESGVRVVISPGGRMRELELLNKLVATYRGKADIFRASNDNWEIQKPFYPDITALVIFPRLRPADILYAAQNDYRVPSGITRHIIPNRAININIPIGILMADWPLERKTEWLDNWWMERMAANTLRYYAESTFSFND